MSKSILELQEQYDRDNRQSAELVAADPPRYPGLMQEWAKAILAKQPAVTQPVRRGQLSLFQKNAA